MKILMPSDNLSTNGLTRVYPFAKIMSEDHDVTVIGPMDKEIYKPLQSDKSIKYITTKYRKIFPFYLKNELDIYRNLNADIIHSFKITLPSFLPALIKKIKDKKQKLVLDIDDWESQYMLDNYFSYNPIKLAKFTFADLYVPESYFLKKALEKQTKKANAIITSSRTLQRMFGGTWIPTGPNTDYLNPENFSSKTIREEFNLQDKTIVLFMGLPKKHKGILELTKVFNELEKTNPELHLLIVGADKSNPITKELKSSTNITVEGFRDYKDIPLFNKAADIVCVPHMNTPSANAQLPIKIFDPMAMEKPVITTDTTDMKEIFQNCGTIIKDNTELKQAILNYANDKDLRVKHGKQARLECLNKYSWKIMKKKTEEIYQSL